MPFEGTCPIEERIALFQGYDTKVFTVVDLCARYGVARQSSAGSCVPDFPASNCEPVSNPYSPEQMHFPQVSLAARFRISRFAFRTGPHKLQSVGWQAQACRPR
jgi:hypothetical protein